MTFVDNLVDYIVNGNCSEGSFKWYLLVGDLYGVIETADDDNVLQIVALAMWVRDKAPILSYGSRDLVRSWTKNRGLFGIHGIDAVDTWKSTNCIE